MTHQFCNKYVTFIVSTDIQSKQQRPKVQTAVQVGWACSDASCNVSDEVSSCSSSVSNKRKWMTVWLLGDAIHEAFTWLALKHMANGEQISTEVLLSLQTFDHNGKKEQQKKISDWLNHITEQTFKKPQRMTFSKSRDCMQHFSYKQQQPCLCQPNHDCFCHRFA